MPRNIEELVNQQMRRSEMARQVARDSGCAHANPVVTISRRMGSGARIVASKLAKDLGWSLWDKELLDAIADDAHVSRKVVEAFDERHSSELELLVRAALGEHDVGGFMYARHLATAVLAISHLGNAIILGRGAHFILPDALSVRIDASDELRVRNMMSYENLTHGEAEARLKASRHERESFLVSTFGKEKLQNVHYDLTIWMDKFRPDDAVEIIKMAITRWCERRPDDQQEEAK
jgi:cytidylate kinase